VRRGARTQYAGLGYCSKEGSDQLEASLVIAGLDAVDPPFPAGSFQRLQKISTGLPKNFRKRSISFRYSPKISIETIYFSKPYARSCRLNG
jgi:hypothetical protein